MISVPNLPDYDPTTEMDLRTAANQVRGRKNRKVDMRAIRRWCNEGCRIVDDVDLVRFPAVKPGKEHLTCQPWLDAWNAFVQKVRVDYARRQLDRFERCKAAARG